MTGEMVPSGTARIACALELPDGSGWVRLQSGDPTVQPSINYRYLHNENDMRRMRDAVRLACSILESDAYRGISEGRIAPDDDTLTSDDHLDAWIRQTLGAAPATSPAPAASAPTATAWPLPTSSAACAVSTACGSPTPPSCPR